MTKRTLLVLAASVLAAVNVSARAQDAPPTAPRPEAPVVAPATPSAPVAVAPHVTAVSPPSAPVMALAAPSHVTAVLAPTAPIAATAPMALAAPTSPPAAFALSAAPALAPLPPQQGSVIYMSGDNYLGINAEEITRENMGRYNLTGEPRGVGVREVLKDSPAERAGLKTGDVILRFDGEAVTSLRKLNRLIDESAPEYRARLTIRRGGSEQEVNVTLGKREFGREFGGLLNDEKWRKQTEMWNKNSEQMRKYSDQMRKRAEEWQQKNPGLYSVFLGAGRRIGVSTNTLGKQLADYFGVEHGILITNVEADSPAARAGLKAGDIVTEADGERVGEAGDLTRVLNRKEEGEVTLTVVRDRNRRSVRVTPEKRKTPAGTWELKPGALVIDIPTVAVTTPGIKIDLPRVVVTPNVKVTPNVNITPKVTVTPRAKVVAPARIL